MVTNEQLFELEVLECEASRLASTLYNRALCDTSGQSMRLKRLSEKAFVRAKRRFKVAINAYRIQNGLPL